MHGHNVTPLNGREVNGALVAELEKALAEAKAGEVVGVAVVKMHSDLTASQTIVGKVGGSMMIGQFRIAEADLLAITLAGRDR